MTQESATNFEVAKAQAVAAYGEAAQGWGRFRVYISKNPLRGFWIGVLVGASPAAALLKFFL